MRPIRNFGSPALLHVDLAAAAPPDASALLAKTIERAGIIATNPAVFLYDKRTTIDYLGAEGEAARQKVKLFEGTVTGGVPSEKLVAVEEQQLSGRN